MVLFLTFSSLPRTALKLSVKGGVHTPADALPGLSKAEKLSLVLPVILLIRCWRVTSFIFVNNCLTHLANVLVMWGLCGKEEEIVTALGEQLNLGRPPWDCRVGRAWRELQTTAPKAVERSKEGPPPLRGYVKTNSHRAVDWNRPVASQRSPALSRTNTARV